MKTKLLLVILILFFKNTYSQIYQIETIAGDGTIGYSGDGFAPINAKLNTPNQIAVDQAGNLFIAEDYNHVIRKISVGGVITTVAGNGTMGFSGDGASATSAQLNRVCGVAVDALGNIYIGDADNHRIRKVDAVSGNISTIAGTGVNGHSGDGGLATLAEIGFVSNIQVDVAGNVYFACQNNSYSVRKINTSGIISTVAGNGTSGFSGDGGLATNAQLGSASAICFDAAGNLYISDFTNMRIRKVDNSGIITTIVGTGTSGNGGDGGQATSAQLFYPYGIAVDASNNLYICDAGNNKIRKVNTLGIISTIAGTGGFFGGYSGDGGPATAAQLSNPSAIWVDPSGNAAFIGDYANHAIRQLAICTCLGIEEHEFVNDGSGIYPNPGNGVFTMKVKEKGIYTIMNSLGEAVKIIENSGETVDVSELSEGIYYIYGKDFNSKIIITK